MNSNQTGGNLSGLEIAIIGMACRLPGANDLETFWENLKNGVMSVSRFTDEELIEAGLSPQVFNDPRYVRASAIVDGADQFDASFFDFSPREVELMDPQHRVFLECAWEALESAGYDPENCEYPIGVYAGANMNTYLLNLYSNVDLTESMGNVHLLVGNDKDYLATRVSYKMNLRGPSVTVQTACSTSLVAVHLACRALLSGECDMALAGGVSIKVPQKAGYQYQEGGIYSPDGYCRAFDIQGQGTTFGSGVGVVMLKRLEQALADNDHIYAVIKGSAINNDGAAKVGYTAPSLDGQAAVIRAAHLMAEVDAGTITYVEAHATATPLGDPVEVRALTEAFSASTTAKNFCALGSVKTNFGHLASAAGVAGLIKTVLSLKHRLIPPSLHFQQPNPHIDFNNSPFFVNTALLPWPESASPRRAGVSSFGVGGTNAHVILEEAPAQPTAEPHTSAQQTSEQRAHTTDSHSSSHLLLLSARTSSALDAMTARLASALSNYTDADLPHIAYTLQVGRRSFPHRRLLVCHSIDEARTILETNDSSRLLTSVCEASSPSIVFMFPGQGAQHVQMAKELYQHEPVFRSTVDYCAKVLKSYLGCDIRQLLYPTGGDESQNQARERLNETWVTQPALFVVEYALAQVLKASGVEAQAMIGHSIGEYVAATLSGVFRVEDALAVVAARGRLMQDLPRGAMLAVALEEEKLVPRLSRQLSLAAVNGREACVVAGAVEAVDEFEAQLMTEGVRCRRLQTSHAFHSHMMESILGSFVERVSHVTKNRPNIPWVSNVTGKWISEEEAVDPAYWGRHLRQTVRFDEGLRLLSQESNRVLLEVGPGRTLSNLARQQSRGMRTIETIASTEQRPSDAVTMLTALGKLWLAGVPLKFKKEGRRVPLPTYPFERQSYWALPDEPKSDGAASQQASSSKQSSALASKYAVPTWVRASSPPTNPATHDWLVRVDAQGNGSELAERLMAAGQRVVTVLTGPRYERCAETTYRIRDGVREDYLALLANLPAGQSPLRIAYPFVHTTSSAQNQPEENDALSAGLNGFLLLTQALMEQKHPVMLWMVTDEVHDVESADVVCSEKAAALALGSLLAREAPHVSFHSLDAGAAFTKQVNRSLSLDSLVAELCAETPPTAVAYRGRQRWISVLAPLPLTEQAQLRPHKARSVFLLTNAWSHVGRAIAHDLASRAQARLVLIDSTPEPTAEVDALLAAGAEVQVCSAQLTDAEALGKVVAQASARFGAIDGVIHLDGVADEDEIPLAELDAETLIRQLRRTREEFRTLAGMLAGEEPETALIWSTGGARKGRATLSAVKAMVLDAEAARWRATKDTSWMDVNSATWRREPQSAESQSDGASISITEGLEAFRSILYSNSVARIRVAPPEFAQHNGHQPSTRSALSRETGKNPASDAQSDLPAGNATTNEAFDSDLERDVAAIWQQLLRVERIGPRDNFFDLGGDSLLASQLLTHLREHFNVQIPLESLFEAPTVSEVAKRIKGLLTADNQNDLPPLCPVPRDAPLPLSFAQQRLWFLDQLVPGSPFYNVPIAVHLKGQLSQAALASCINTIVERHEVLRTTFALLEGVPVQHVHPAMHVNLSTTNIEGLPEDERASRAQRLLIEEAQRPFDLTSEPPLRALLLRLDDGEHYLLLTLHHIVCDAWSIGVLLSEMAALYGAYSDGNQPKLPPLPIQYADFSVWQRKWLKGRVLEEQLTYWTRQLDGLTPLALPPSHPVPLEPTFRGEQQSFAFGLALSEALKELGRQEESTLFMVLLAVFQSVLHHHTRQEDIVVGTDVANRIHAATENMIGFFANQLVLRTNLAGNPRFREILGRVRQVTLGAYAHQELPFDKLVEAINPPRNPRGTPLFQVKFVLQNAPMPVLEVQGLRLSPLSVEHGTAKFDLLFNLEDTEEGITGILEYSTDIYDGAAAERLIQDFESLAQRVAERPDSSLEELSAFLAEQQRERDSMKRQMRKTLQHEKLLKTRRKGRIIESEEEVS
jgi:acyl transferase domain-containing protein/acyl carrier protein/uncharacterized coiled-coil protein SlyX